MDGKRIVRTCLISSLLMLVSEIAIAQAASFYSNLVSQESSGNMSAVNKVSTAAGSTQMTEGALQSAGLIKSTGGITSANYNGGGWGNATVAPNQFGVTNEASYLASPAAQQYYTTQYLSTLYNTGQNMGLTSQIGKTIPGTNDQLTASGLLACEYVGGDGGCNKLLTTGTTGNSAIDAEILKRTDQANATDSSAVTNAAASGTSSGAGSTGGSTGSSGSVAAGVTSAGPGIYCNPSIATMQISNGAAAVNDWVALAGQPSTGYTTLNGGGVLSAAGLGSGSSSLFGGSSFGQLSCLQRLLNSGLNIVFAPPSLDSLLNALEQAVCNEVNSLFQQVTQPITSAMYNATSGLSGGGGLSNIGGGFLPGFNLGSMGGGLNVGTGGSGLNVGISALQGNTSWFSTNNTGSQVTGYGSLFGRGNTNSNSTTITPSPSMGGLY
jgi:hypothetical protein